MHNEEKNETVTQYVLSLSRRLERGDESQASREQDDRTTLRMLDAARNIRE